MFFKKAYRTTCKREQYKYARVELLEPVHFSFTTVAQKHTFVKLNTVEPLALAWSLLDAYAKCRIFSTNNFF